MDEIDTYPLQNVAIIFNLQYIFIYEDVDLIWNILIIWNGLVCLASVLYIFVMSVYRGSSHAKHLLNNLAIMFDSFPIYIVRTD